MVWGCRVGSPRPIKSNLYLTHPSPTLSPPLSRWSSELLDIGWGQGDSFKKKSSTQYGWLLIYDDKFASKDSSQWKDLRNNRTDRLSSSVLRIQGFGLSSRLDPWLDHNTIECFLVAEDLMRWFWLTQRTDGDIPDAVIRGIAYVDQVVGSRKLVASIA